MSIFCSQCRVIHRHDVAAINVLQAMLLIFTVIACQYSPLSHECPNDRMWMVAARMRAWQLGLIDVTQASLISNNSNTGRERDRYRGKQYAR